MRDTRETLQWYRDHETTGQLGYNPDGMCLKICREARGLPSRYPSALAAQLATPAKHRIRQVSEITRGMVVFYDDPKDSNPYGHIVTVVGRVKGANRSELSSLLVRTNSVRSGRVVVVRGNYFPVRWGDEFQFAATWLNGYELDLEHPAGGKRVDRPPLTKKAPRLREAIKELEASREYHEKKGHDRLVRALSRDIQAIRQTIRDFS